MEKKVNTKRKGGGQPGNTNACKWTEEKALKVGSDLISWLRKSHKNIYFEDFLYVENAFYKNEDKKGVVYYPELISYLSNKYLSFLNLIKIAEKIQECRLKKFGMVKNATMPIFVLKNKHGYSDKVELKNKDADKPPLNKDEFEESLKNIKLEIENTLKNIGQ